MASVLIALGWVALWFLWPSLGRWDARAKEMPAPRVSFAPALTSEGKAYMWPDRIARSFRTGAEGQAPAAGTLDSMLSPLERLPRYLDREEGCSWMTNGGMTDAGGPWLDVGYYHPVWKDEQVFPVNSLSREMRLLSEVSGELRKQSFEVPVFSAEEMKRFDKPWQVVVRVEVSESGGPSHVILETGCEDPRINSTVVKAMYRGRIPKPGVACGGRVTLSYGLP